MPSSSLQIDYFFHINKINKQKHLEILILKKEDKKGSFALFASPLKYFTVKSLIFVRTKQRFVLYQNLRV
jgi:hypothetical protein